MLVLRVLEQAVLVELQELEVLAELLVLVVQILKLQEQPEPQVLMVLQARKEIKVYKAPVVYKVLVVALV
jgi:hypothetical protein